MCIDFFKSDRKSLSCFVLALQRAWPTGSGKKDRLNNGRWLIKVQRMGQWMRMTRTPRGQPEDNKQSNQWGELAERVLWGWRRPRQKVMEESQDDSSCQISTQTFLIENISSIYTYIHIIIYHIHNIYIYIIENPVRRCSSQRSYW